MEILAAIAAIAALLWAVILFRCTGLFGGCVAVLLGGILFGHFFFHVGPVTLDRLLLAALCGIYLLARYQQWLPTRQLAKTDIAMIAFVGALTVNTFTTDWHIDGAQPVATLLFYFICPLLLYWLVRSVEVTPKQLLGMFVCFSIFGIYLSLTAIAEKYSLYSLVFPRFIGSPEHTEFFGRARGPLLNPSANGILLAFGFASTLMCLRHVNRIGQLALILTLPLFALGFYCTLTRCAWLGGMAVCGVFTIAYLPRRVAISLACAAAIGGGLVVAAKWSSLSAFKRDKNVSVADMKKSASLRPMLAETAWRMFQARPLMGVGLSQYRRHNIYYTADRSSGLNLELAREYVQHNVWLALLVECGLIGCVLYILVTAYWFLDAWHLARSPSAPPEATEAAVLFAAVLAAYLPNAFFHDVTIMPMINTVLFFLAGLVRGLAVQFNSAQQLQSAPQPMAPGGERHRVAPVG